VESAFCARARTHFARWRRSDAFSLIEILVAVALLAVIIVGLLAMFYQVQRAFRAGTAQSDIMEGGRATMNLLVRDFQDMAAAYFRQATNCVIERSPYNPPLSAATSQRLASGNSRDNYLQEISLLSRLNDEWFGIAYRVGFATNGVGTLYRLVEKTNSATLPDDRANAVSNVFRFARLASPETHPDSFYRVVDGVVHLTITPYDTNGYVYHDNDPASLPNATANVGGLLVTNPTVHVLNPDFFSFHSNALPAYLDIELAVLEPSALAKFRVREEIGPAQAAEYLARQIGATHVFRQRVAIRPAATDVGVRY
jgi:type II secretory pathway pseudopilin PulG